METSRSWLIYLLKFLGLVGVSSIRFVVLVFSSVQTFQNSSLHRIFHLLSGVVGFLKPLLYIYLSSALVAHVTMLALPFVTESFWRTSSLPRAMFHFGSC